MNIHMIAANTIPFPIIVYHRVIDIFKLLPFGKELE